MLLSCLQTASAPSRVSDALTLVSDCYEQLGRGDSWLSRDERWKLCDGIERRRHHAFDRSYLGDDYFRSDAVVAPAACANCRCLIRGRRRDCGLLLTSHILGTNTIGALAHGAIVRQCTCKHLE